MFARERFADHSAESVRSVLEMCERLAVEQFAPANRVADSVEPAHVGDEVRLPHTSRAAIRAYVDSGMLCAAQDHEDGGMQLPYVVELAANAFFAKASVALSSSAMLTVGNLNLLVAHGSSTQREVFARREMQGDWFGTMCLSEPQAGSSLADITTRAVPDGRQYVTDRLGPRYRINGRKMWISNGEHDLASNIVHLVLAKVPLEDGTLPPGTRGISLFIVPKWLVDERGGLTGERNDVVLAGLNHKLGYRGIPNTLLNFGEGRFPVAGRAGAVGYLVGDVGDGLKYMFHMMNEARIGVGLGAVALGFAGYEVSLAYARERRQGRTVAAQGKSITAQPARIVEHADVRRMLLAQKAYCEGGLALELYCGALVDECRTGPSHRVADRKALLELLTPVAKSWPSEWCLEANSLAIQVLGGCGYTRDFPVEQYWRDNRLNMIHEGTHGVQGIDLLGRKIPAAGGRALALLSEEMDATASRASAFSVLSSHSGRLRAARDAVVAAARAAWATGDPSRAIANATVFLQAFGHLTVAWLLLDVATTAAQARESGRGNATDDLLQGKLCAAEYFFDFELPRVRAWLEPVQRGSAAALDTREEWLDP